MQSLLFWWRRRDFDALQFRVHPCCDTLDVSRGEIRWKQRSIVEVGLGPAYHIEVLIAWLHTGRKSSIREKLDWVIVDTTSSAFLKIGGAVEGAGAKRSNSLISRQSNEYLDEQF